MTGGDRELTMTTRAWLRLGVRRRDPVEPVSLRVPLEEARLALVSTGGARTAVQEPFDTGKRGDASFRPVPAEVDPVDLLFEHPHYDTESARRDPDTIFPLRLLRRLVREGTVGSLAPTAYSMMGYVPFTRELERSTAPAMGELMQAEDVDAALFCPAWPTCNQTVGLVARELESGGIATVCLCLLREVAEKVQPPRTLLVPFGWGRPLGPPGQAGLHRRVARAALSLLAEVPEGTLLRTWSG